jgi:hypothetical protein
MVVQEGDRVRGDRTEFRHLQEIEMASTDDRNPLHHTRKMQRAMQELRDHLREDIEKVDEPQFKAMFETSAEVLGGLIKAFRDYEQKNESAWRR